MNRFYLNYLVSAFLLLCGIFYSANVYAQPPAGAILKFKETFGGDATTDPKFRPDSLPKGTVSLIFGKITAAFTYPTGASVVPNTGYYTIAKSSAGAPYPVWWGSGITATTQSKANAWFDHTYSINGLGDTIPNNPSYTLGSKGYMLVMNPLDTVTTKGPSVLYQDTIRDLCPNTNLYFEVFAGNLIQIGQPAASVPPILQFIVRDAVTGNIIASSPLTTITRTTPNNWTRASMTFMTGSTGAIVVQVKDAQASSTGNDFVLDDFSVYLSLPILKISAPTCYYCPNDSMFMTVSYNDPLHTFGANPLVEWLYSTNPNDTITLWQHAAYGDTIAKTEQPGYYRVVVGTGVNVRAQHYDCCSISDTIRVCEIQPDTLYWKKNPQNQDWNNPLNWEHADGSSTPYAPSKCVDVHIPGYSGMYPSLDITATKPTTSCRDIWFHFGGLTGKPHLLDYDSAYVQYNFGINGGLSNGDPWSAPNMTRGRWYSLAGPLQKIVSGDFVVGGKPTMWYRAYATSTQTPVNGTLTGEWYVPDNYMGYDLGKQYNAIAVGAGALYAAPGYTLDAIGEGPSYQTNIEGLKGIFEMPYFDDAVKTAWHRLPVQSNDTTYFHYYYGDMPDQPIAPDSISFIKRGGESYRFIFEGAPFSSGSAGVYTMPVSSPGLDIMVGNPFMSILDFDKFSADNGGAITKYRLFDGTNYLSYSVGGGAANDLTKYIAPLQAFFIASPASGQLTFNANNEAVADNAAITPTLKGNQLRSASAAGSSGMKPDVLYLKAESPAGKSYLTLSMQQQNIAEDNLILLLPSSSMNENASLLPQLYAVDAAGQKNVIQFEGGYVKNVSLGMLCSDPGAQITLTVQNAESMAVDSLMLLDKVTGETINLKLQNTYTFNNDVATSDRFELLLGNKVMTGIAPEPTAEPVRAWMNGNMLYVSAVSAITDVSVAALQGITIKQDRNIGQTAYSQALNLPAGVYLVTVKLATGEKRTVKIVNK